MKYKTEFRLKKGFTIHIDGLPYEYLGGGMVGTNTNLEKFYEKENTENKKNGLVKSPRKGKRAGKSKESRRSKVFSKKTLRTSV